MRTTEESIRQLLEMLDHPDAYTEQEILDIVNRNGDTRETYSLMAEAKRCSRHRQAKESADVDVAWQRFLAKMRSEEKSQFRKIAASLIGVLLASSIAFAAIHIARQYQKQETRQTENAGYMQTPVTTVSADAVAEDTATVQPVVYDNIPLEKMLPEIAARYDASVTFANDEVRQLRFRFVWNPQQGIDQVISDLNQFERLTVTRKDSQITVDRLLNPCKK